MTGKIKRACAALALAGLCLLAGCKSAGGGLAGGGAVSRPAQVESAELQFTRPAPGDTVAVFDTSAGVFRAVLFPDEAPQTCENFIGLAQAGYYDGLTITRAEAGFVVEAGRGADGSVATVWGGSGCPPEYTDRLHHYAGALCAAAAEDGLSLQEVIDGYAAAGGAPYLDYTDTVFGQVYEGMETVDAIAAADVDENGAPLEAVTIHSVAIETYG